MLHVKIYVCCHYSAFQKVPSFCICVVSGIGASFTFLSFLVLASTSCCREVKVSLSSRVSSSCTNICCWISLSLHVWKHSSKCHFLGFQQQLLPSLFSLCISQVILNCEVCWWIKTAPELQYFQYLMLQLKGEGVSSYCYISTTV